MSETVNAYWNISLDCICPKCQACIDVTESDDSLFDYVQPAEDKKGYEVTCPICQHCFSVNMIY